MSLTTALQWMIQATLTDGYNTASIGEVYNESMQDGTADGEADIAYGHVHTIADSSTPEVLDLTDLTSIGGAVSFVELTTVYIRNLSADQAITVGGGANAIDLGAGAANAIAVGKRGVLSLQNPDTGIAVAAGTGDILRLNVASGENIEVLVVLIGRSLDS